MASMECDPIAGVPASGGSPEVVPCPDAEAVGPCIRVVRQVTPDLVEALGRLLPQLSERLQAPDAEALRRIVGSPSSVLLVAECGGCIVGSLTLVWYDVPSGRKAWIEDVVVDARWRGRGIATCLVERAIDQARRVSPCTVMLTSRPSRVAANRLYRHMGFGSKETNVYKIEV